MNAPQPTSQELDRPRSCFVIGPIGNPYAKHGSPELDAYEHHLTVFEKVIAPACEKHGFVAVRADGIAHAGDITEQVCRHVIEDGLDEMTRQMDLITQAIETIGTVTEQNSSELLVLTQANAPMSACLASVARFSSTLSTPAGEMHAAAQEFATRMTALDSGMRAALSLIENTPPKERDEGSLEFLEQLVALEEASRIGLSQISSFGTAADGMTLLSRHLRKPVKDMSSAVKLMLSVGAYIGEWADKARTLIEKTLE
ncbi:hypothetical protein [Kitasatospora sp. NPDC088783]|uniref:hypothetical protein n=1 Tax=Kitasatospora sp. NPDC088783 TaxID=3364077 RepID=UPI003801915D